MTYFLPLHGNFRTYLDGNLLHCVGTGIENTPRYNEGIYFQQSNSVWVNLYIPSQLDWRETGLVLRQEGDITRGEPVRLTVVKAGTQNANLNFRIPSWISQPAKIKLNGKVQERAAKSSSYVTITRVWKAGDVVVLTLPSALRLEKARTTPRWFPYSSDPCCSQENWDVTILPKTLGIKTLFEDSRRACS